QQVYVANVFRQDLIWKGYIGELTFVEIADKRELTGITFPDQVLPENIRDVDLLFARIEFVEVGIGILLAHVERGEIVLLAVVVVIPKNADAEIRVVENEAAEIAHERLHTDAQRNEIVIVREIAQMNFGERLLQRPEFFFAGGAVLRIRIYDITFFDVDIVVIVNDE